MCDFMKEAEEGVYELVESVICYVDGLRAVFMTAFGGKRLWDSLCYGSRLW